MTYETLSSHTINKITPNKVQKNYNYHVGVYVRNEEKKLTEVERTPTGTRIEDYFPLIIENLNKRGNWNMIESEFVMDTKFLDFCWTNIAQIDIKSSINSRFLVDGVNNYISNKKELYNKLGDCEFVPIHIPFSKKNINITKDNFDKKFINNSVIIKPDDGTCGIGILVQKNYNFDKLVEHINKYNFDNWTISEIIISKICNGYITSNRIYFLVVKKNNETIDSYYYDHFMNYRAEKKFMGNVDDKHEFITNYYDHDKQEKHFITNRFIPHNIWLNMFTDEQQKLIYEKMDNLFSTVTDRIKDGLLASNDNKTGNRLSFHVYGADVIVDKDLNVKLLELNGAPAMNIKTRFFNVKNRLDYFDLFDDLLELTVDEIYKPLIPKVTKNRFRKVYSGTVQHNEIYIYYISDSIVKSYPFIFSALKKRNDVRRTKNMYDNIDVFYGLREKYVTDETNMNFYDELLNYNNSRTMANAGIINKIQGVTYYLANKGRIYNKIIAKYGDNNSIHPASYTFYYNDNDNDKLINFLKKNMSNNPSIKKWILKPTHGSRGDGIKILSRKKKFLNMFNDDEKIINNIMNHIKKYNNLNLPNGNIIDNHDKDDKEIKSKYNCWILSQYIDNPHLFNGKKHNIRFYAFLTINGKLPTYENLMVNNHYGYMDLYILNECLMYSAVLDYDSSTIPDIYKNLDPTFIDKMRNLTNLEIISNLAKKIPEINDVELKRANTNLLDNAFRNDRNLINSIKEQGRQIIIKCINSVKYDLRSLNRFSDNYKGSFNLLAFDTLLDDDEKLWFIEVNRGPDMRALEINLGFDKCVDMFDELFNINLSSLDKNTDVNIDKNDDLKYFTKIPIKYKPMNI